MTAIPVPSTVLLIIVHYGDVGLTRRLLESVKRLDHFANMDLLIVNNDLREGVSDSLQSIMNCTSNVTLIEPGNNRGYFGGAKLAIEHYRVARGGLPAWIIITNNDVVIDDRLFLEKLMSRDLQKVAVIAPCILSTWTRSDQNPFMRRRPGRLRVAELRFWLTNYYLAHFHESLSLVKKVLWARLNSSSLVRRHRDPNMRETIYAPHGAFIIFSRAFFDHGGCIDAGFFLYGEEVSVAETCRRIGLPAVYEPELMVIHQEHSATGRKLSRIKYECQKKALGYLADRYLTDIS